MELWQILQQIMDERNYKVADIAHICGLPDSTVRGIVTRKQKSIALDVAFRLSRGLGISLETLAGETDAQIEPPAGAFAPTGDSPEEIRAHLDQSLRAFGVIKPGNTPSRGEKYLLEAIMAMIAAYRAGQEEAKQ